LREAGAILESPSSDLRLRTPLPFHGRHGRSRRYLGRVGTESSG
jgi:hypothetical protein